MTLLPELVPDRIDWHVFAVMGNTMPPRDPDDGEEDEDEEQDEEEDQADETPVVREPDEDQSGMLGDSLSFGECDPQPTCGVLVRPAAFKVGLIPRAVDGEWTKFSARQPIGVRG